MDRYARLMTVLDDNPEGLDGPPSKWRSGVVRGDRTYRELRLQMDNDAFAIDGWWVYDDEPPGTDHRVSLNLSRSEAKRLAWWIFRWQVSEWFGVRRRLYYWALTKHLDLVAPNRRAR